MVSNNVSLSFSRKLESSGVTVAEWVVLREMSAEDSKTSPGCIAQLTGLTRGAITKLVDRLLQKNLVSRSPSTEDRRFQEIQLTSSAKNLVPKLAALADENDAEFFSVLSTSERKLLLGLLQKVASKNRFQNTPIE